MSQYNNGATTRSERYAVKSHKQIVALTTATIVTATISSVTINASADEIKDNQQPDVVSQSGVTAPKSDFDKAKDSETQKLADLQAQQKADEQAKAQANADAQAATEQANAKALADAQAAQVAKDQADAQAAAQKLADQQAADESAKAQQAQATQVAHDAEVAKQQQAATDFANQQAQESGSAQAQRDTATNQYNSDTKATQDDAATADKAIDSDAQKATDKATTDQTTANQTVDAIQAQSTTDAKTQQTSASTKQTADNTKTESAQKQANASTEASAQKNVDTAQANVNKSSAKAATPANPYDTNYDRDNSQAPSSINSVGNLPTSISDPKIPASHVNDAGYYDYYNYFGENDNTAQIKGAPTDAQQTELADYAVTLVNSYRTTHGMPPVRWTEQNQKAVIASAKAREEANAGFKHTAYLGSDVTTKTDNAYAAQGLWFAGENIGVSAFSDLTMLSAKVNILNVITAMIYQDGAHGNGHLQNFMMDDQIMGFAMQKDNTGDWPYVVIFQNASMTGNAGPLTDMATTSTQTIEAARGGNTQANKQALADAQANLSQVKFDNATQLSNLQSKNQKAIDSINQAFADAIVQIKSTHDKTISQNATIYGNTIAQIKADATAKHDTNATKLAETLANLKDNYDAKISSIKDMSPEELANKKATEKAAFDKVQATELATFEAQQAQDAKTFATNLDTALANLKAQLDADLATKTAQGAKNLKQLEIQNTDAYNQLVSANAKALANLKTSNVKSYAKAQADSQAYLNAINPANAKPSTPDHSKPNSGNTGKPSAPSHQTGHNTPTGTDSSQTAKNSSHVTNSNSNATSQKTNVSSHDDNFIYDANTQALNRVSFENQYTNVTFHPKINTLVPVKQVNPVITTQASLLPQTAKNQQHNNQALLISLFSLLGMSLYVPKHLRNKRFNA